MGVEVLWTIFKNQFSELPVSLGSRIPRIHSFRGGLSPNTEKHLPTMLLHSHHCFSISHSIMPPLCHEAMCTPCASPSGKFGPREPPTGRQRHPMAHARARSRAHPRAHPKMSRQWFAPVRRFCLFIFKKMIPARGPQVSFFMNFRLRRAGLGKSLASLGNSAAASWELGWAGLRKFRQVGGDGKS